MHSNKSLQAKGRHPNAEMGAQDEVQQHCTENTTGDTWQSPLLTNQSSHEHGRSIDALPPRAGMDCAGSGCGGGAEQETDAKENTRRQDLKGNDGTLPGGAE